MDNLFGNIKKLNRHENTEVTQKKLNRDEVLANYSFDYDVDDELKEYLKDINHLFVWHGRKTCMARTPNCKDCTVKDFCKKYKQENKS